MAESEVRMTLRLPTALKSDLEGLSTKTRRSLNATIVVILERALKLDPLIESL